MAIRLIFYFPSFVASIGGKEIGVEAMDRWRQFYKLEDIHEFSWVVAEEMLAQMLGQQKVKDLTLTSHLPYFLKT